MTIVMAKMLGFCGGCPPRFWTSRVADGGEQ